MHAAGRVRDARDVARHGDGHRAHVQGIDARRGQPRDDPPLEHARAAVRVTADGHRRPLRQSGRKGGPQARRELGSLIDIHQPRHPIAAKEHAAPLGAPNEARLDGGPRLHLLVGPDLDPRVDDGALADDGRIPHDGTLEHDCLALEGALPTDDGAAQLGPLADVRVAPHNAPVHIGVIVHDAIVEHHAGAVDHHAPLDLDPRPEVDRPVKLGVGRDVDVLPHPHATAQVGAHLGDLYAPLDHIVAGAHILLQVAHVAPVAARHVAVQRLPPLQERREEVLGKVIGDAGLEIVEDLRLEDIDARVHRVRDHFSPARLFEKALDAARIVRDDHPVLERLGHTVEGNGGQRLLRFVEGNDRRQINVGDGVATDDDKGLIEVLLGLLDAPRRPQRRLLDGVGDVHPEALAVAKIVLNVLGHVLERHHDIGYTMTLEQVEDVPDNRLVHHGHHRFGVVDRQWS